MPDVIDSDGNSAVSSLSAPKEKPKQKRLFRAFNLNKTGMKGREKESQILEDAFDRVSDSTSGKSELIVVTGSSGSGKTCLAESLRSPVSLERKGYFVCGKFDQLFANDRPYSAIVNAFTDLIDLILLSDQLEETRASVNDALRADARLMCNLLSNLQYLTGTSIGYDSSHQETNMRQAFLRFKTMCRKFIRAVSTALHPLVIVFDDVQWADSASIDVIKNLATDPESRHVMTIALCRSDEPMSINELVSLDHRDSQRKSIPHTLIELGSLDLVGVNDLVSTALKDDPELTMDLSRTVMKRTAGNPYFTLRFLENLEASCLISYDLQFERWRWDSNRILGATTLSDNILEIVTAKIRRLGVGVQKVLQIASCLSFQCRLDVLEKVFMEVAAASDADDDSAWVDSGDMKLQEIVTFACNEGIIEKPSDKEYRFSHDRVRDSLYRMVGDETERKALHLTIGRLLERLANESKDSDETKTLTLMSVEQKNRGVDLIVDSDEIFTLINLNKYAAEIATEKGAFNAAGQYLKYALAGLDPETRWKTSYDLTLDLSTKLCELETAAGSFNDSKATAEDIIRHARSFDDTIRAYTALVDSVGMEGNVREAYTISRTLLPSLGVELPKKGNLRSVVVELVKTKFAARKLLRKGSVACESNISDPKVLAALRLLSSIATWSVLLNESEILVVALLKMMRMTIKHGQNEYSPYAYAGYGLILGSIGGRDKAFQFGQEAIEMVKNFGAAQIGARAMTIASQYCLHWRRPIQREVSLNLEACAFAMETGDLDTAFLTAQTTVTCMYYSGAPLSECENQASKSVEQMIELNFRTWYDLTVPYLQMFMNLMGQSDDALVLTGAAMNQEEAELTMRENGNVMGLRTIWLAQLYLAASFDDYTLGLELIERLTDSAERACAHMNYYEFKFVAAQVYLGACRAEDLGKMKKRKYMSEARKIIRQFDKFVKEGCKNVVPLLAILQAELQLVSTLSSSPHKATTAAELSKVRVAYDRAAAEAQKAELMQYEALAHEKACFALLELGIVHDDAVVTHVMRAMELYSTWGATEKVVRLDEFRKESLPRGGKLDVHTAKTVPTTLYAQNLREDDGVQHNRKTLTHLHQIEKL